MMDWLIQDLVLVLIVGVFAGGLLRQLNARTALPPWEVHFSLPWAFSAGLPGLLSAGLYYLVVQASGLFPLFSGTSTGPVVLRSSLDCALLLAAMNFLPDRIPAPARLPAPPPEPASPDNPRITPRDEPYNAFVAASTLRGLVAGLVMGGLNGLLMAPIDWVAFGLAIVPAQLNLAASGALAGWAIGRWRLGRHRSLLGGLIGYVLLHWGFLAMLGGEFPWPLMADLLAVMGILVATRYCADVRIEHHSKPKDHRKQTGCKDC